MKCDADREGWKLTHSSVSYTLYTRLYHRDFLGDRPMSHTLLTPRMWLRVCIWYKNLWILHNIFFSFVGCTRDRTQVLHIEPHTSLALFKNYFWGCSKSCFLSHKAAQYELVLVIPCLSLLECQDYTYQPPLWLTLYSYKEVFPIPTTHSKGHFYSFSWQRQRCRVDDYF